MTHRSPLLASLLLVLFGLGSIAAPVVHRATHAAEHAVAAEAAHAVADAHVHGDGVGLTGALPDWMELEEACAVCQIHLVSVQEATAGASYAPNHAVAPRPNGAQAAAPWNASRPARGPPA